MRSEKGASLIVTIVSLAILGIVSLTYLGGTNTSLKSTTIAKRQATAQSLIFSEIEYVKKCAYQYSSSEYPVDPTLVIPEGWSVPPPVVEPVHATDDGIQKIIVRVEYDGREILSVFTYKVNR